MTDTRTPAEQDARRLMDAAIARGKDTRMSAWTRRAHEGALPYKVYADLHTDARADVVRETPAETLRRTLPPVAAVAPSAVVKPSGLVFPHSYDVPREEHDRMLDEQREQVLDWPVRS